MIEADRVLRPLREAESAIEQLETYESPAVLLEALRATWRAVDRTLRTLLRSDPAAPDDIRMAALSADQLTPDAILTELRRRDLVSLELAGRIHELRQAVERTGAGDIRASAADTAMDVVRMLEREVRSVGQAAGTQVAGESGGLAGAPGSAGSSRAAEPPRQAGSATSTARLHGAEAMPAAAGPGVESMLLHSRLRLPGGPLFLMLVGGLILVIAVVAVLLVGRESEMDRGVAAFSDGRSGVAEQHFRNVLIRDRDHVTARLYLARILRGQGRNEEAAQLLRAAATTAPRDPAVRRELGYLFLALDRPQAAVDQFRQAVELDAAEPLNWVGLVESLRRTGDPAAAEALRRAPVSAQEMIRQRGG